MYKNLVLYRNELKNNIVPRYKMIGIVTELLLSKEIFAKNSEIDTFLVNIFMVRYKGYVMKSRTLMVARCCKIISRSEDKDYNIYKKKLFNFITQEIEKVKEEEKVKLEKNQFDGWIK